jgi:hypothetical protein
MNSLQQLLNNLQQIKIQLLYVEQEEQVRAFPHPKIPGLDLSLFDLSHEATRSHLVIPEPMYVPAEWRFCHLINELRTSIKEAKAYLQTEYDQQKTSPRNSVVEEICK